MSEIADARVRVRVGEVVYHTTKATLIESQLFATLFALPPPPDDEYFVDADPKLFDHVMRYLRTKTFPLFYDNHKGHDTHLYITLLQQAEFYQVAKLIDWLAEKKYLKAVKKTTRSFAHTFIGEGQARNMHAYWRGDEELTIVSHKAYRKRALKCPAGNWEHDGGTTAACMRNRCFAVGRLTDLQEQAALDVHGYLTLVEIRKDLLMPEGIDASGPLRAATENPPPYVEGDAAPTTQTSAPNIEISVPTDPDT